MGYYVRQTKNKRLTPNWKVQFISYKKQDCVTDAKKPRKEWNIPRQRWLPLGFHESMSFEQAQARAKQINAQLEIKRQEELRRKIELEYDTLKTQCNAAVPEIYKTEFELKFISRPHHTKSSKKRFYTSWSATQRMLQEIPIDPFDWFENNHLFYDYFFRKQFSFSYIKKVLLVTNLWGQFLSRRLGQTFVRVPIPRGTERARLLEAYLQKRGDRPLQSDPITPIKLEKAKPKLRTIQYNWLYLSVWFGLRPQEVDQLKDDRFVRLQRDLNGTLILWIYQTKLMAVSPRHRWKLIPIIFREQKLGLKIIRDKFFERPRIRTVKRHFGFRTTLYGGRKGFTDLMLAHEQNFIHISQWMGHSSIDRTWRSYKSRRIVHYSVREKKKTA